MGRVLSKLRCCIPEVPSFSDFNSQAEIPCGISVEHIYRAMLDFTDFLRTADTALVRKNMLRLEDILMPANFSSMVGEFIASNLPLHCSGVARNTYHNGHPDLLPRGKYPKDAAQHAGADGIEIKASRNLNGWQGHNAEDAWLMVFVFESGRPSDSLRAIPQRPFRFLAVYGALLAKTDWQFAGRSLTSRRTITATVLPIGFQKMAKNWVYRNPALTIKA